MPKFVMTENRKTSQKPQKHKQIYRLTLP